MPERAERSGAARFLEQLSMLAAEWAGSSLAFGGELEVLRRHYQTLAKLAAEDSDLSMSHSIDEAESGHAEKKRKNEPLP